MTPRDPNNPRHLGRSLEERFWALVDKSEDCWILGKDGKAPRADVWFEGKTRNATRVAWYLQTGEWPPDDLFVLHTCDMGRCVRRLHLYLGTHNDNMRDRHDRGHYTSWLKSRTPEQRQRAIENWNTKRLQTLARKKLLRAS